MKRKFVHLAALLTMLFIVVTGFTTNAHAVAISSVNNHTEPLCSQTRCNGMNPFSSYCNDSLSYIVRGVPTSDGIVYLWFSPTCQTNWAETIQTTINTNYLANANITRADGVRYDGTSYSDKVVTPMVYAPDPITAQACGSVNNAPGGCTGYY
jgi:hypothetical protein